MNGWMEMVISKHFLCKDLVHHPTETTFYIKVYIVIPIGSMYGIVPEGIHRSLVGG